MTLIQIYNVLTAYKQTHIWPIFTGMAKKIEKHVQVSSGPGAI